MKQFINTNEISYFWTPKHGKHTMNATF